ncbi:hypothetical protein HK107_00830 [Parvularcula sp. ZS-1/3]|uniref:Uncharacterized protein n=1 Tax=Parvularcula mediterranea TaxID=2732508 RepID=A0A7Y3RJL8_9PROT|nr:hypothetical protein [Parvularcula mediterranea]NNU14865.1 hypothetical protein [Parvularcula mediterranea]
MLPPMKFLAFLLTLVVLTVALLYVLGDRRQPQTKTITQEVELQAR